MNYDVLRRPNSCCTWTTRADFLLTTSERFDVITADIIQPTHAGAGGLYSREYFTRARDALRSGGLMLQWIGQREDTAYKLIARTFLECLPGDHGWVDGTLLVGTVAPLTIRGRPSSGNAPMPATREALAAVDSPARRPGGWYSAGPATLRAFVGPGPLLTDDRPLVEYFRTLPQGEPPAQLERLHDDVRPIVVP